MNKLNKINKPYLYCLQISFIQQWLKEFNNLIRKINKLNKMFLHSHARLLGECTGIRLERERQEMYGVWSCVTYKVVGIFTFIRNFQIKLFNQYTIKSMFITNYNSTMYSFFCYINIARMFSILRHGTIFQGVILYWITWVNYDSI